VGDGGKLSQESRVARRIRKGNQWSDLPNMRREVSIGVAATYFASEKGGREHYALHLSNKLADLGYNITVICGKPFFRKLEPLSSRFELDYVPQLYFLRVLARAPEIERVKVFSFIASKFHYHQYKLQCHLHLLRNHSFDIINTHDEESLHGIVKIARRYRIPLIATVHYPPSPQGARYLKHVSAVIAINKEIRNCIEKYGVLHPHAHLHVVPGGVDLALFKPVSKETCKRTLEIDGKMILFVGKLVPIKNLYNLLYAFKRVSSAIEDALLMIVGDGPLKQSLVHTAQKLDLKNVKFLGAITNEDLLTYYNAADAFVLPSLDESYPLVCLEAAACAVPIVVSCGAKSFIEDFGEALFLVDPRSPESISDGIVKSLTSSDEIREKTEIALEKVKKYDWMEKAKEVANINRQCLEGRR